MVPTRGRCATCPLFSQVCYMVREEARRLLHLPEHIFKLLARHCDDEHADRNMCTHVVQFTRHKVSRTHAPAPAPDP